MKFIEWLSIKAKDHHDIDIHEIESVYDHAHVAVQLVRMYEDATNQDFLSSISTIANLGSGAYGVYNSSENQKILPKDVENRLIYFGNKRKIDLLPKNVIKQYFPTIPEKNIKNSDTIRVNVRRIITEFKDDMFSAIMEIASTIIHECTHEIERETKGRTDENGPKAAEIAFKNWAFPKKQMISQKLNI